MQEPIDAEFIQRAGLIHFESIVAGLFRCEQLHDHVVGELVVIEKTQNESQDGDEEAPQAANLRQKIQDRVACPLDHSQVPINHNLEALDQVRLVLIGDRARLFELEDSGVVFLRDLIEVDHLVLQSELRPRHDILLTSLPVTYRQQFNLTFHHHCLVAVFTLVKADLVV